MRVQVDRRLCSGQARCNAVAPAVYGLDDEGFSVPVDGELAADDLAAAARGALACPEGAITVVDEHGEALPEDELQRLTGA